MIAAQAMRQLFGVTAKNDDLGNAEPLTAIWPKYPGYVVRLDRAGERELVSLSWGFRTTKTSKKTGKTLQPAAWNNALDDSLTKSGLWTTSFQERRCLIPATSFWEAKGRQPATYYWFGLKGTEERPPFAFAGLWTISHFEGPDGKDKCPAYTMITTTANEIVKPVHPDRIPVILTPDTYEQWLTGEPIDAQELLRPYPADQMEVFKSGGDEKSDAVG
jgi:putative SOS response-associated peptidase YedK